MFILGRLIAGSLTFAASTAVVLAGWQFMLVLEEWCKGPSSLPQLQAVAEQQTIRAEALQPTERRWLPVFGMARRTLNQQTEPEKEAFDYRLKGVVATGSMRYAILTKGGRDLLVTEGDSLDGGPEILAIHAEGLDVQLRDRVLSLGFAENRPVAIKRLAQETPRNAVPDQRFATMLPPKEATEVIFQDMNQEELLKVLRKAEADRLSKGMFLENR